MKSWSTLFLSLILASPALAADAPRNPKKSDYPPTLEGAKVEVYRSVGDVKLNAYIFEPKPAAGAGGRPTGRPAIVFFFGGGWRSGTPQQFEQQCRYLASRGMVAITCDYRVSSRHDVKAKDCVEDAKAAIRWVRANASRLGIDPQRVAAGGGSAGGHLAACTGVVPGFDPKDADPKISSIPNALVLFNPALVLANYEGGQPLPGERAEDLRARMGVDPKELSPLHHVKKGAPPTIIFHGEGDTTVPFATAQAFAQAMKAAGNECRLVGYPGQPHGFFNYGRAGNEHFRKTLGEADRFLASLGYLSGAPTVDSFFRKP